MLGFCLLWACAGLMKDYSFKYPLPPSVCVCAHACVNVNVGALLWRSEEGIGSSRVGVSGELPEVGAETWAPVLHRQFMLLTAELALPLQLPVAPVWQGTCSCAWVLISFLPPWGTRLICCFKTLVLSSPFVPHCFYLWWPAGCLIQCLTKTKKHTNKKKPQKTTKKFLY